MNKKTEGLIKAVAKSEKRKMNSQQKEVPSVWRGLGMLGLVGWAVSVPTLIGIFLGIWIDSRQGKEHLWTLICLLGGVILGCLNAWHWIKRETKDE